MKEGSPFLAKGDVIEMHGYFSATERAGPAIAVVCDSTKAREVFRVKALLAKEDYWHDHLMTSKKMVDIRLQQTKEETSQLERLGKI